MKLHLENMGPINEANIDIGKITIVAGKNACGKSTLSKFLYSFLESNSYNRTDIAYSSIVNHIEQELRYIRSVLIRFDSFNNDLDFEISDNSSTNREILEKYNSLKEEILNLNLSESIVDDFSKRFGEIDELIKIVEENQNPLFISLMRSLITSEFSSNALNSFIQVNSLDNSFNYTMDFKNHSFYSDESFKIKDGVIVSNVFYMDSFSILDIFEHRKYANTFHSNHLESLKNSITDSSNKYSVFDKKINKDLKEIEEGVYDIIGGEFVFERGEFFFISSNNVKSNMSNTPSGTKQIGILQLLLANRKLIENSFLIIDEPEVNLHPEWQFKLAEALVLISKMLNVSIYINTHSPLFIESVYSFAEYYDFNDKIHYHLAEVSQNNLFEINEVKKGHLSKIYDDLGEPYFAIALLDALKSSLDNAD